MSNLRLRGNETVLELGCGTGAAARHLAAALQAGGRLVCTDTSASMQKAARRALKGYGQAEFKLGELQDLNLARASVDMMVAHFVLCHIGPASRPALAAAIGRLLKSRSHWIVREPLTGKHGMTSRQIEAVARRAGLKRVLSWIEKLPWFGPVYTGVFMK